MNELNLFNKHGKPIAYLYNGADIYLFDGTPVAYLYGENVYNYDGRYLGYFEKGWIRDKNGYCVFFTDESENVGLSKPFKEFVPLKSFKKMKPFKSFRELTPFRPISKLSWSQFLDQAYFLQ